MNYKRPIYTKTWRVSSFTDSEKKDENAIYIDRAKFEKVVSDMIILYTTMVHSPEGVRFPHRSIEGLVVTVNKEKKIITAEAWEESNISVVLDELGLPAYASY